MAMMYVDEGMMERMDMRRLSELPRWGGVSDPSLLYQRRTPPPHGSHALSPCAGAAASNWIPLLRSRAQPRVPCEAPAATALRGAEAVSSTSAGPSTPVVERAPLPVVVRARLAVLGEESNPPLDVFPAPMPREEVRHADGA